MNANELRIGNLVGIGENALHADGGKNQIYEISELKTDVVQFKMFHSSEYYKDLAPIPLTEEILLKFGFEKKGDFWFVKSGIKIENRNNGFSYFRYLNEIKIISVHQLQNLFFSLCGEELKFEDIS